MKNTLYSIATFRSAQLLQRRQVSGIVGRAYHILPTRKSQQQAEDVDYEQFYRYTSGRWLWDEDARLQERYKRFNVRGLKQIAAKAAGAHSCSSITKLEEGACSKIFSLIMDNGTSVIARIPMPNVGPSVARIMASEVATMDFVQSVVGIPVPKVLSWSGNTDNEAESEYIIMEKARGVRLSTIWRGMNIHDKYKIIDDLIGIEEKLLSVSFSSYGNLYFASDSVGASIGLSITGDLQQSLKKYAEERFVVGPIADEEFWCTSNGHYFHNRGPWHSAREYLQAIAERESSKAPAVLDNEQQHRSSLLDKFIVISPYLLPREQYLNVPALRHPALHPWNILVDNNQITSIVDWQGAWICPLLMQQERPHLVRHRGEVMLRLPEGYEEMEDKNAKRRVRDQTESSIIAFSYETQTKNRNKLLRDIALLPIAEKRLQTMQFASDVWADDVLPLRECLIQLQRHWDKMEIDEPCPIQFSPEELEAHHAVADEWNAQADFWANLDGFIGRDGFTLPEDFDRALKWFRELLIENGFDPDEEDEDDRKEDKSGLA